MPNGHGFRFPYGIPIVIYPLLGIGVALGTGRWWGVALTVLTVLLAVLFLWQALSSREYDAIRKKDPTLNRTTWITNWMLFYTLPAIVIGAFGIAANFLR